MGVINPQAWETDKELGRKKKRQKTEVHAMQMKKSVEWISRSSQ